ncbi:MAG: sugar ABC transporter ATP-binding protein [Rhizobiales bacterium]|nr:sugar ABC transporter ATP-binding protein [Hyphomicrobiales bacterium]
MHDIGFDVQRGHVLGLVGENGSGKSTTMNILGGVHRRDRGTILLDGVPVEPQSPREAQELGIGFIHQELSLFPNLSIEENLFLDHFPRLGAWLPFIDRRRLRRRATEALQLVGLDVPPGTPVSSLPQGERQLVEIVKVLTRESRIIIFDEPTTSLTARESERLFEIIGRLKARGISIIYISHILGDVMRLCDDIVVLRDGQVVATAPTSGIAIDDIVRHMVGRTIDNLFPEGASAVDTTRSALALRGVSQPGTVRDISFDLHPGEVLGVSGLMGSGRSELARIIFGLDGYAEGTITVGGSPLPPGSPRAAMERGIAFLTEDRRGEGLMMEASIRDNIVLPSVPRYASPWLHLVRPMELGAKAQAIAEDVRISAKSIDRTAVRTLSGGNQQKVVIAKWLLRQPSVFILDEPTRGIDVGAKYEVYKIIRRLVAEGAAVLLISSEIEELIGMSDRIMVMGRGEIRGFHDRAAFDREAIMRTALWD